MQAEPSAVPGSSRNLSCDYPAMAVLLLGWYGLRGLLSREVRSDGPYDFSITISYFWDPSLSLTLLTGLRLAFAFCVSRRVWLSGS